MSLDCFSSSKLASKIQLELFSEQRVLKPKAEKVQLIDSYHDQDVLGCTPYNSFFR